MKPSISVQGLRKQFKVHKRQGIITSLLRPEYTYVDAVKDISFTVEKGEAVAFLGPNGAGKTTTTKMLSGLMFPTAGTVEVLGYTPFNRDKAFLKRIGLVMGNKAGLNWDLTPTQSFALLRHIYEMPEAQFKKRVNVLTELLDVKDKLDTQLRRLSLGERMKMELVGAILHEPEVLFLDEPTIGLDIITKKNIRSFLRDIQKNSQTTLILTSHDMDDIERVCDRVIVINHGQKVYDDTLESLAGRYRQNRFVRCVFGTPPNQQRLQELAEIVETQGDSYLFKTDTSHMPALISYLSTESDMVDMHIESVPLEEVIAELFV